MQDYLRGYLQVLPEYQRRRIEDIIKENQDIFGVQSISESEFEMVIDRLAKDHDQMTRFIPQGGKLDEDLYNTFFSNLHIDLNLMFLEAQLVESASVNYERIFDGIINDLEKEVKSLRERVNSLRLVSEGEDGLIVKEYSFNDKSQMEVDVDKHGYLFMDRDGSSISPSIIERNHDQYYLVLSKTNEIDCIRNESSEPTAEIKITDRRGARSVGVEDKKYQIANAIDASDQTYWAEVVLVDTQIQSSIKK